MSAEELRELADWLAADDYAAQDRYRAAAYLRACADAMDAGPVAWEHNGFVSANKGRVEHDEMINRSCGFRAKPIFALYPLAMPAPIRMPEPMTRAELDEVLDGYGSGDGVRHYEYELCRGIEADTLRRVKEVNE